MPTLSHSQWTCLANGEVVVTIQSVVFFRMILYTFLYGVLLSASSTWLIVCTSAHIKVLIKSVPLFRIKEEINHRIIPLNYLYNDLYLSQAITKLADFCFVGRNADLLTWIKKPFHPYMYYIYDIYLLIAFSYASIWDPYDNSVKCNNVTKTNRN